MTEWPQKNAIHMRISRELALDYGLVEPTAEELAERDEADRKWQARRQAAQLRKGEILAALDALRTKGDTISAVIAHHAPDEDRRYCQGCDMGCSCEAADWPCSTVALILDRAGALDGIEARDLELIKWSGDL